MTVLVPKDKLNCVMHSFFDEALRQRIFQSVLPPWGDGYGAPLLNYSVIYRKLYLKKFE